MSELIHYDEQIKDFIIPDHPLAVRQDEKKKSVTIHRSTGNLTPEGVFKNWKALGIRMHFAVDGKGVPAQFARVDQNCLAVINNLGNIESIHVEMATSTDEPDFEVSAETLKATARLIGWLFVYVIDDHPTRDNLFRHDFWYPVNCPGPFIDRIFIVFVEEVQGWYAYFRNQQKHPIPIEIDAPTNESVLQIRAIQKALGLGVTGEWNEETDQSVLELRRKYRR